MREGPRAYFGASAPPPPHGRERRVPEMNEPMRVRAALLRSLSKTLSGSYALSRARALLSDLDSARPPRLRLALRRGSHRVSQQRVSSSEGSAHLQPPQPFALPLGGLDLHRDRVAHPRCVRAGGPASLPPPPPAHAKAPHAQRSEGKPASSKATDRSRSRGGCTATGIVGRW